MDDISKLVVLKHYIPRLLIPSMSSICITKFPLSFAENTAPLKLANFNGGLNNYGGNKKMGRNVEMASVSKEVKKDGRTNIDQKFVKKC